MKKGENIVVVIDGDIKGAQVIGVLPDGNVQISVRDYYGDYLDFPRRQVFTASEWEARA
jgi:hypothetical protein